MKMSTAKIFLAIVTLVAIIAFNSLTFAKEVPFTIEDRDRLIRLEVKLSEIEKRFEQIEKRFEQIEKRFEQIEKRFEQIITFMWMLVVIFTGLTATTIGFAIWDRRTMIRPFESKTKLLEDSILEQRKKMDTLLEALKGLAKQDEKVAEVLKKLNLL